MTTKIPVVLFVSLVALLCSVRNGPGSTTPPDAAAPQVPLVMDSAVSAEFGLDAPVWSERAPGIENTVAIAAGTDSYLIVWQQYGPARWDVYGARVSFSGQVLDPAGFLITPPSGSRGPSYFGFPEELIPAVAWDGHNFLVIWDDPRDLWTYAVYGARVSPDGVVLDPDGIVIGRGPLRTEEPGVAYAGRPALAWNGENYLAVWEHFDSPAISGARLTPEGTVLDPDPIPISVGGDAKRFPSAAWDGGNFLVVWESGADIAAARVSPDGVVLDPSGVAVSSAEGQQSRPAVSSDGAGSLVVWSDDRGDVTGGAFPRIYGARVTSDGQVADPDGFAISADRGVAPSLAWNGANYLVVWSTVPLVFPPSDFALDNDVIGARVSATGLVLDPRRNPHQPPNRRCGPARRRF